MKSSREFWLFPIGSAGDVLPLVGIARELQRRGHRVTVHTNALFADTCAALDVPFEELGTGAEVDSVLQDPGLWRPGPASVRVAIGAADRLVRRTFERIAAHPQPRKLTVVHGALGFGARLAEEALGVRAITVHRAPGAMKSVERPPRLPGFPLPGWVPRALVRAY
jgi:hypothetical protein